MTLFKFLLIFCFFDTFSRTNYKKIKYERPSLVSSSNLYHCLAPGTFGYHSGNWYKQFNPYPYRYCHYCNPLQYHFRSQAALTERNLHEGKLTAELRGLVKQHLYIQPYFHIQTALNNPLYCSLLQVYINTPPQHIAH